MAKLTVNQFCNGLNIAKRPEFGCPNVKPEEAALITAKDKKSGAITAAATEIRAKRSAAASDTGDSGFELEADLGLSLSTRSLGDEISDKNSAYVKNSYGALWSSTGPGSGNPGERLRFAARYKIQPKDAKYTVDLGLAVGIDEKKPRYDDQDLARQFHSIQQTSVVVTLGVTGQLSNDVSVSAEIGAGAVENSIDDADKPKPVETSVQAKKTATMGALDGTYLFGSARTTLALKLGKGASLFTGVEVKTDNTEASFPLESGNNATFGLRGVDATWVAGVRILLGGSK